MAHEILSTSFPQIKFSDDHSGVPHRAIVRSSIVEDDVLVIATRFSHLTKGATSAIIYLDEGDVRALRDFLNDWLEDRPASI